MKKGFEEIDALLECVLEKGFESNWAGSEEGFLRNARSE